MSAVDQKNFLLEQEKVGQREEEGNQMYMYQDHLGGGISTHLLLYCVMAHPVYDKRDARAGEHPDDIRCQATVESCKALVHPSVCNHRCDGAVVRACKHRVTLLGVD